MREGGLAPRWRTILLGAILLVAILFRFYRLGNIPNGFFYDEAARGYDAYALLRTGADQYGQRLPLFPKGFGDYTPGLYTYTCIPFIWMFGLTEFGTRFSAALFGVLTVLVTFSLAKEFFDERLALWSAFLLAISPWHIQASRTGVEWVLLPFFVVVGMYLVKKGLADGKYLVWSALPLALALYTYAPVKLFLPLLLIGVAVVYRAYLLQRKKQLVLAAFIFLAVAGPAIRFALTTEGMARFRAVSILSDRPAVGAVWAFVQNYVSYFSPSFLFVTGDSNLIHSVRSVGQLYWFELPLLLTGLYLFLRERGPTHRFFLFWLVVSPLSVSLHRESPNAALILGSIPVFQIISARGLSSLVGFAGRAASIAARNRARIGLTVVTVLAIFNVGAYVRDLFLEYPVYSAGLWKHGFRDTVSAIESVPDPVDSVLVSNRISLAHIYVLFYAAYDPQAYQRHPIPIEQGHFWPSGTVGKYVFCDHISDEVEPDRDNLYWVRPGELRGADGQDVELVYESRLPDGEPVFQVYRFYTPRLVRHRLATLDASAPVRWSQAVEFGGDVRDSGQALAWPVDFGGLVELLGYEPVGGQVMPGEEVQVVSYWRALGKSEEPLSIFVHLLDSRSTVWGQRDGLDVSPGTLQAGAVFAQAHRFRVAPDAPPGRYQLELGLYSPVTMQRLAVMDGDRAIADRALLAPVTVGAR